jgi:4-nitrophenyl phosphatase
MRYKAYLFDLDGTLYRGDHPFPHAAETLAKLRQNGSAIRFLTNNSGTTTQAVATKLVRMGIEAEQGEVLTSGMAAAAHLVRENLRKLFVIGEPGLVEVLREQHLEVANADPEGYVKPKEGDSYDAVVCGICRGFTYWLMNAAFQAIRAGAQFVATNPDPTYPMENGRLEPGAGTLVSAVQTCSGVRPYMAGKPQPDMVLLALDSCGVKAADALVVGDRIDTDIEAAKAAGCPSALVLGGVTEEAEGIVAIHDLRELLR